LSNPSQPSIVAEDDDKDELPSFQKRGKLRFRAQIYLISLGGLRADGLLCHGSGAAWCSARVPKMAIYYLCFALPSWSATCYKESTPGRSSLGIWPVLPIVITESFRISMMSRSNTMITHTVLISGIRSLRQNRDFGPSPICDDGV
jgi:hypothetical protein